PRSRRGCGGSATRCGCTCASSTSRRRRCRHRPTRPRCTRWPGRTGASTSRPAPFAPPPGPRSRRRWRRARATRRCSPPR
ncbi:hypothetical protein EO238_32880, partial [Citrobacter sp. AAK_AS5]